MNTKGVDIRKIKITHPENGLSSVSKMRCGWKDCPLKTKKTKQPVGFLKHSTLMAHCGECHDNLLGPDTNVTYEL
jgi:hypothetical protein